ncbi:MAG: hypothetical protein IJ228_01305 [Succinivibrio sp.]|nr:hypothetical protein [Succinivibrio sp.]
MRPDLAWQQEFYAYLAVIASSLLWFIGAMFVDAYRGFVMIFGVLFVLGGVLGVYSCVSRLLRDMSREFEKRELQSDAMKAQLNDLRSEVSELKTRVPPEQTVGFELPVDSREAVE